MDNSQSPILLSKSGAIATVTLNRPHRMNSVNGEMAALLEATILECEADDDIAVTVLTGAGKAFCSGMDLAAFEQNGTKGIMRGEAHFAGFVGLKRRKPVIAAVNGPAVAGGFEIVMACDMAVAADTAIFSIPECKRGLIAAAGGLFRLAQRVPLALVNEFALTGDAIEAQRMYELGLLNKVVPASDVLEAAEALAHRVARSAPLSVAFSLELAKVAASSDNRDLWSLNNSFLDRCVTSQDVQEGARAFLEKRAPVWRGR